MSNCTINRGGGDDNGGCSCGNGGIGGYSGGNTSTGRNGGSGIVIVRYELP